jgi:hypothetical protein
MGMKKGFLFTSLFTIFTLFSSAQISFEKTYGDSGEDWGLKIIQTADDGFIILAFIDHNSTPDAGSLIIKTNSVGDTIWTKFYHTNVAWVGDCIQTADHGYAITGNYSIGTFITRFDSLGDSLWTKYYLPDTIGGPALSIVEDFVDHSLMIAGFSSRMGMGGICCFPFVIRTDSIGNQLWENDLNFLIYGRALNIVQSTADSNFVISCCHISGPPDHFICKLDRNNNFIPFSCSNYISMSCECRIDKSSDGGYIISGTDGDYYPRPILIKLDSCGHVEWNKTFANFRHGTLTTVSHASEAKDGGFVITGSSLSFQELMILKTNSAGDSLWTNSYGGFDEEAGHSIITCRDSGFAVVGYTKSYGAGKKDIYFIKTDSQGIVTSTKTFPERHPLVPYFTPNPFTTQLAIHFPQPQNKIGRLTIFNSFGQLMLEKEIRLENQTLNLSDLPHGMYFIRINTGTEIWTEKIVK